MIRSDEHISLWHQVPSWAISLALHAALFVLFLTTMRGCGGNVDGQAGEEFRSIGIFVKDADSPDPETQPQETVTDSDTSAQDAVDMSVDDQPPSELSQPASTVPLIGGGPPIAPPAIVDDIGVETRPNGSPPALPSALGLGPGETSFMDIRDSGKRFVYIIDCSGSMTGNRIRFAQAQLIGSLNLLDPAQEFQILFYNTSVTSLSLRGGDRDTLYHANEINTSAARRAIRAVQPNQGTRHVPALERAIRMRPDVVFFLTDGHDTPPTVADLDRIRRLNGGKSRVHCVEFGQGALLTPITWLRTLARQNGGRYKYVDVNQLPRR